MYRLSKSTCLRIRTQNRTPLEEEKKQVSFGGPAPLSLEGRDMIRSVVKPPKPPISIRSIQTFLQETLQEDASYWKIRDFLKYVLGYSYK